MQASNGSSGLIVTGLLAITRPIDSTARIFSEILALKAAARERAQQFRGQTPSNLPLLREPIR